MCCGAGTLSSSEVGGTGETSAAWSFSGSSLRKGSLRDPMSLFPVANTVNAPRGDGWTAGPDGFRRRGMGFRPSSGVASSMRSGQNAAHWRRPYLLCRASESRCRSPSTRPRLRNRDLVVEHGPVDHIDLRHKGAVFDALQLRRTRTPLTAQNLETE